MNEGNIERLSKSVNIVINAVLAVMILVCAFSLFYALLFRGVSDGIAKDIILFVLGAVSTNLTQVVSYYFGSSKGSEDKSKIIHDTMSRRKSKK